MNIRKKPSSSGSSTTQASSFPAVGIARSKKRMGAGHRSSSSTHGLKTLWTTGKWFTQQWITRDGSYPLMTGGWFKIEKKKPWAGEWPHMANRRVSLGLKSWPKPTWKGHHAQFLSPWRRPNRSMTESIHATPSYSARFVQDVSKWTVTGSPISPSSCSCSKLVNKIHF